MDRVVIVYPRFHYSTKEIAEIWGKQHTHGYTKIRKNGLDEDTTTLAVEAFYLLEGEFDKLIVVGEVNIPVFIEACGLEQDKVEFILGKETSGIDALSRAVGTNTAVIVVDAPSSADVKQDSILSTAAVGIVLPTAVSVLRKEVKTGVSEERTTGDLINFSDAQHIKLQKPLHTSEGDHIYHVASLRSLRKITSLTSVVSEVGYAGCVNPLLEFCGWLQREHHNTVEISSSDVNCTILLELEKKGEIEVRTIDFNQPIPYVKFMQKQVLPDNPAQISQGAYISEPVYNANTASRYRLQANKCEQCGTLNFPPRKYCKQCHGTTIAGPSLSREGTLYSFTKILKGAAPTEFDFQQLLEGEYSVGVIEFPEGQRVITQISDCEFDELAIGDKMRMVFRKLYEQNGKPRYGYKFVKINE